MSPGTVDYLLLPMHVDALAIGANPKSPNKGGNIGWARIALDYSLLDNGWYRGDELRGWLTGPAFAPQSLRPGIHLHFRLPAALTHGSAPAGLPEQMQFPKIPNRWLVQRYIKQPGGKLLATLFVVRSDKRSDGQATTVPLFTASSGQASLQREGIGACEEIAQASPAVFDEGDTPSGLVLTAVTGGDGAFSAHYPACRTVLGFHDAGLAKTAKATLSYLVSGWYSTPDDDPWQQALFTALKKNDPDDPDAPIRSLREWMAEHRLTYPLDDGLDAATLPGKLICHGSIRNVDWDPGADYSMHPDFNEFSDATKYSVEIGNTTSEALASRVLEKIVGVPTASGGPDLDLLEDVATAFQGGFLAQKLSPAEIDAELHRSGFGTVRSGTMWLLEAGRKSPGDQRLSPPLPPALQIKLDELNRCQALWDRLRRQFDSYQWELYALWHREIAARRNEDSEAEEALHARTLELKSYLSAYWSVKTVADAKSSLERALASVLQDPIGIRIDDGKDPVDAGASNAAYTLSSSDDAPFYVPADPAMIVTGPALKRGGAYKFQGAAPCRKAGDEFKGYHVHKYKGGSCPGKHDFSAIDPKHFTDLVNLGKPWAATLLKEMILLDEIAGLSPENEFIEDPLPDGLSTFNTCAQKERDDGHSGITDRQFNDERTKQLKTFRDSIGMVAWNRNPWIPQVLMWDAEWYSDYAPGGLGPDFITRRWTLGQPAEADLKYAKRMDFVPTDPPPVELAVAQSIRGYTFLTNLSVQTGVPANDGPASHSDAIGTVRELLQNLAQNSPSMTQTAGGFHDALLMRHLGDQLPPLDYDKSLEDSPPTFFADAIANDLRAHGGADRNNLAAAIGQWSPDLSKSFFPIRSGRLRITNLWVMDSFGQTVMVPFLPGPKTRPAPATSFSRRLAAAPASDGLFPLRPRFAQPMRLVFAPVSPICGWIMLNRLEQSMTVHSGDGSVLGAMQKKFNMHGSEYRFYWVPAPGGSDEPALGDPPRLTGRSIANPHLHDFVHFVLGLSADAGSAFDALISRAIDAVEHRTPDKDPTLSLLVGRPLALVRASLRFESLGVPALDQNSSWIRPGELAATLNRTLGQAVPALGDELLDTGGFGDVNWPVRLGDAALPSDGLVGYFKGDPGPEPRTLFAAGGLQVGGSHPGVLESEQTLVLNSRCEAVVTMLMDPGAQVCAASGVLPCAFLELPGSESASVKQVREAFFQTAPVLGAGLTPHIPKPSDDYGQWSWACHPPVTLNNSGPRWAQDSNLISASERESDGVAWPTISEGWLSVKMSPVRVQSFSMRNGNQRPPKNSEVTLQWDVRGATKLELSQIFGERRLLVQAWPGTVGLKLPVHYPVMVTADTVYLIEASDEDGNVDTRQLSIKVQEG
jgi:hypothetical protein